MRDAPQTIIELADAFAAGFDPVDIAARFGIDLYRLRLLCLAESAHRTIKPSRIKGKGIRYAWIAAPEDAIALAEYVILNESNARLAR